MTFCDKSNPVWRCSAPDPVLRIRWLAARQRSSHILYIVFLRLDFNFFFRCGQEKPKFRNPVLQTGDSDPVAVSFHQVLFFLCDRFVCEKTGLPLADQAKNALRLALDLCFANTIYRQAINHRHKIMRLERLCKSFSCELIVGNLCAKQCTGTSRE